MSVLTAAGWVAAVITGFLALAFIASLPEMINDWRTTPATVRAVRGKNALEALQKLKSGSLDARATDRFGNNALHAALDCYDDERMRRAPALAGFLMQRDPDIDARNHHGRTPLDLAVERGHDVEVVRALLAAGAKPGDALHAAAAKRGRAAMAVVGALIDAGAPVDAPNALGSTPLHQAAKFSTPEMIRALIGRGAGVDARDREGRTPLHEALWFPGLNATAATERVAALVAAGADPDAADSRGRTPRKLAEESGEAAVIAAISSQ